MATTSIEWTDATWNPVTGCTKVSPGCKNCYAETVAGRFWGKQYEPNADGTQRRFTDVRCHPERLEEPLRWRKPRRVFVNSMSDLFHEDVPFPFIAAVFGVMAAAPQQTFQVLTKRPEQALAWFRWLREETAEPSPHFALRWFASHELGNGSDEDQDRWADRFWNILGPEGKCAWPLPSVWLGVSCEDQATADERIPLLLQTPAAVRFLSLEPLLSPVDLRNRLSGIHWVIVGGESGPCARPCDVAWIRAILDQCRSAGTRLFIKQLGSQPYDSTDNPRGQPALRLRNRKGGDPAEWPEDLRVREFPR